MSLTTKANVLLIAPELSSITDDNIWNQYLADVDQEISASIFGNETERAARYLVAHYVSLYKSSLSGSVSGGTLKRERVDEVEKEYYNPYPNNKFDKSGYGLTKYGIVFLSIRSRKVNAFSVIPPAY